MPCDQVPPLIRAPAFNRTPLILHSEDWVYCKRSVKPREHVITEYRITTEERAQEKMLRIYAGDKYTCRQRYASHRHIGFH